MLEELSLCVDDFCVGLTLEASTYFDGKTLPRNAYRPIWSYNDFKLFEFYTITHEIKPLNNSQHAG